MIEKVDRWVLPVSGWTVTRSWSDWAFWLQLTGPGAEPAIIRIEAPVIVRLRDGRIGRLQPPKPDIAPPAELNLLGLIVERATAYKDGTLGLEFADRSALWVDPDPDYEAWEYAGDGGSKVISLPGGELAIWKAEAGVVTDRTA